MERRFVAALDRDGAVVRGASLDRIACESSRYRGIVPIDNIDPLSRKQYFLAPGPPVLRIDSQITYRPLDIIVDETRNMPYAAAAM
jgi:hypothetical protein